YSYGNQYNRSDLSRARAEKWFGKIYSQTEEWVKTNNGLTSLTNSGKIEESELEERFIKLLSIYAEQQEGWSFTEKKNNGTVYYEFSIEKGDVKALYWLRPQIVLGPKDGIAYNTRTDFLMVCGSYLFKEKEWRDQIPKTAIYLDGYQFHASQENNVFEKDIRIRKAIVAQPEFKTWSLTWTDLDYFQKQLEGDKVSYDNVANLFKNSFGNNYEKLLHTIQKGEKINYSLSLNSVERLLTQMTYPPVEDNKQSWYSFLGSWTKKLLDPSFNPSQLSKLVSKELLYDSYIIANKIKDFNALIPVENDFSPSFLEWNTWVNIGKNNLINQLILGNCVSIDKKEWETFWRFFNLFQSDNFIQINIENAKLVESDEEWSHKLWDLYEDHLHPIIQLAIDKGVITASNADYLDTWIDPDTGYVLADAELILTTIKIAINPSSSESNNILLNGGFTIYDDENIKNIKL
ncbi:MAG: hypothetical protein ABI554_12545, partial [Flavobacterium sp.]